MIRAAALIAGPILVAVLFFQFQAPGLASGVYVELPDGTYVVPGSAVGAVPVASDVTAIAPTSDGPVRSFFIVAADQATAAASAASAKLYFLVVNNADQAFRAEPLALPVTIHQINPRVYRIASIELERGRPLGLQYYRQVLARATGSRATMELVAALVVQDSTGQRRLHSVRVGPVK